MTAATFVLVSADGQGLMEQRHDGHWCYPGGKIEQDDDGDDAETPEEAMIREMMEEIGCVPKAWSPLHITVYGRTDKLGDPDYRMIVFMVWAWEGRIPARSHSEIDAKGREHGDVKLEWFPLLFSLGNGRGSCVSPIASACLYQLEMMHRPGSLEAEYREPPYRDEDGVLRFGQGRIVVEYTGPELVRD